MIALTLWALSLLAVGVAYLRATRRGATRWPRTRTAAFLAGLATLLVTFSPLVERPAERGLTAHMLQHVAIWFLATPLLAAGAPVRAALRGLRPAQQRALAGLLHSRPARLLSRPLIAVLIFDAVVVLSHLPVLFDPAVESGPVHAVQHSVYLWVGLLLWTAVLGADPLPVRAGAIGRVACVLATMPAMALLGAWLSSTSTVTYAPYAHLLGGGALDEQQRAAGIMWITCKVVGALLLVAVAGVALAQEERRQKARERHLDRQSATPADPARPPDLQV